MSIGVKVYNAAGKLQISHDHMIPQLVGIGVSSQFGSDKSEGAESGFVTRSYIVPGMDASNRDVVVYWTIPEGCWAHSQSTFLSGAANAATLGIYLIVPPNTVITSPPVAYMFAVNHVLRSPEEYAMRLWRDSQLMFDSGTLHLSVEKIITNISYEVDVTHQISVDLPAKPAFLIPSVYRDYEDFDGFLVQPDNIALQKEWLGCIKKTSGLVETRLVKVYEKSITASNPNSRDGYQEDLVYGNTTNLIMPVINAALYD